MGECSGSPARILGLDPLERLEEEARSLLGCDPAHGWPHVLRVARWARRIIEEEGLRPDMLTLYVALVLHDVGRGLPGPGHHAEKSARAAESILPRHGLEEILDPVRHAILAHSYSLGVPARTVEASILSDADKLDALGAVGIARVFHTGCQLGRGYEDSLGHFRDKILRLPTLMHYDASRRFAEALAGRVDEFLSWWEDEAG